MSTVIAFAGSPRKQGHTWQLLNELIRGVESKGGEVNVYDLNDPELRGCQGCFYCRANPGCPVDDILTPFYFEIAEASAVVVASPVFFGDVSGQVKMWLDRMFPMLEGSAFQPRFPGKKAVTIFAQGDGDADRFLPAMKRFHGFIDSFGWELRENIVCCDSASPGFEIPGELMKRSYAAGEALATE